MLANPMLLTDFYKTIHHMAYTPKLDTLVSYWTPRMSRIDGIDHVVMFGLQGFIKEWLIDAFNQAFFSRTWEDVSAEYERIIANTMSVQASNSEFLRKLHDLGYLPIEIKAVAEGGRVPIKCPMIQIKNTVKGFGWLVNYLETYMSCNIWMPMTTATIAYQYRMICEYYYNLTVDENDLTMPRINSLCGDFSMRGMSSIASACSASAGHLTSFVGTATIPSILWLEKYYHCDSSKETVGKGTPSTEHSVMSSYGRDGEFECYRHLIEDVFPNGPLSIVSDTYNYWNVLCDILPRLKNSILNRDGKIVIRGDSGDPVDIICGDDNLNDGSPAHKGTVQLLWELFGGKVNNKGYKVLDPHIGAIYGDSITIDRAQQIWDRLEKKGFAISNVILGIGSFTYQYNTRDTFGFALKATHSVIDGKEMFIFKDPITDKIKGNNFKKSQKGMCYIYIDDNGEASFTEEHTLKELEDVKYADNLLKTVFKDSQMIKEYSLQEIRANLWNKF